MAVYYTSCYIVTTKIDIKLLHQFSSLWQREHHYLKTVGEVFSTSWPSQPAKQCCHATKTEEEKLLWEWCYIQCYQIFISLDELKTELPRSVHNLYSRSNITNLVVGNGMLQWMLHDVLMHIEVSSTSGNCIAETSLSLVQGIVQKLHKCSHISKFLFKMLPYTTIFSVQIWHDFTESVK